MVFNYSKLRGRIREKNITEGGFATTLGISSVSISNKLNNKCEFTQQEIMTACKVLDIPMNEILSYFFTLEVKEDLTFDKNI